MQTIFKNMQSFKKPEYRPELKFKQLQYENETLKRLLGFMKDENVHLKTRLSEVLKNNFDNRLLEEVENFQSRFIKEDELIGLLRNDAAELDRLLAREIFEDGQITDQVVKQLKKLQRNIKIAEKQFSKLKLEFNNYLSENM